MLMPKSSSGRWVSMLAILLEMLHILWSVYLEPHLVGFREGDNIVGICYTWFNDYV